MQSETGVLNSASLPRLCHIDYDLFPTVPPAPCTLLLIAFRHSAAVFEEITPAGTVTPYHLHHDSDEIIYVLSGQMTFKIGEEVTVGGPGTYGFMPRGLAHAWKNSGLESGRALFIFTPGTAGKIFEDLRREERPLSSMDDLQLSEIFSRYGWEVVGPPPF